MESIFKFKSFTRKEKTVVHVIGWRGLTHSYSVSLENYFKPFLGLSGHFKFYFTDAPYYISTWKRAKKSIFDDVESPPENEIVDITFRMAAPFDVSQALNSIVTFTFITCESQHHRDDSFVNHSKLLESNTYIITPSEYSKKGLIRVGFSPDKIFVINHGFDFQSLKTYNKQELKIQMGLPLKPFVFLHISALTSNKGLKDICTVFDRICKTKDCVLIIKPSLLFDYTENFSEARKLVSQENIPKIFVIADEISGDMNILYQISDCYLSPYKAEGFNLPVLEALSNNILVITSSLGPTDEIIHPNLFRIESKFVELPVEKGTRIEIEPNIEDFYRLANNSTFLNPVVSPKEFTTKYSIENITNKLITLFYECFSRDYFLDYNKIAILVNLQINYSSMLFNNLINKLIEIYTSSLFLRDIVEYCSINNHHLHVIYCSKIIYLKDRGSFNNVSSYMLKAYNTLINSPEANFDNKIYDYISEKREYFFNETFRGSDISMETIVETYDKAEKYTSQNENKLAIKFYNMYFTLIDENKLITNGDRTLFVAYHNVCVQYFILDQFKSALYFAKKGELINSTHDILLFQIGVIYKQMKDIGNAILYLNKSIEHATSIERKFLAKENLNNLYLNTLNLDKISNITYEDLEGMTNLERKRRILETDILTYDYLNINNHENRLKIDITTDVENNKNKFSYKIRKESNPIKIGYVSGDFYSTAVAFFMHNILKYHTDKFSIFCFANNTIKDVKTDVLINFVEDRKNSITTGEFNVPLGLNFSKESCIPIIKTDSLGKKFYLSPYKNNYYPLENGGWFDISKVSDLEAATFINDIGIDILVDLSGVTVDDRLGIFAYKPAPVQVSYLGFPNTSGLSTIKYRLTDYNTDKNTDASKYTEQFVYIPKCFLCYWNEVSSLPAEYPVDSIYVTFGSLCKIPKLNDELLNIWSRILDRVINSRIVLKISPTDTYIINRALTKLNITRDRLICIGPQAQEIFYKPYDFIDVALDTFPYSGTTTTCDCLTMSTPIITYRQENGYHANNVSSSILENCGLKELIATSLENYIELATELASNKSRIAEYKKTIRGKFRESMDPIDFIKRYEETLSSLVETSS